MYKTTTDSHNSRRTTRPNTGVAHIVLTVAILAIGTSVAIGQTMTEKKPAQEQSASEQKPKWEFLIASGTLIPTGAERGAIKRANLTTAQTSYVVRPHIAINGTLGWARSRDIASVGTPKLEIFTYDLGAEARASQWKAGHSTTFGPFAGGGAGARSYISRNNDVDATHQFAPYVSAGGEFSFRPSVRRVYVRIEVRDYMTGLFGQGAGGVRNDVVAMVGLRFTKPTK